MPHPSSASPERSVLAHATGVVQGVGFRPFVYNLARRLGVRGWVMNTSEGVFAHAEGDAAAVERFVEALRDEAPPMAVVQDVAVREAPPEHFEGFEIRSSKAEEGAITLVSPDIATCEACTAELFDAEDRRHRYPFITCTNCGPRFTIIGDIPYDRKTTTMAAFEMCEACAEEYADPADRRFHAQPDACAICGPRLYLTPAPGWEADVPAGWLWAPELDEEPKRHRDAGAERERSDAIVAEAARLLTGGAILAVKGLGGFHLACDATNEEVVARLRERKHRWGKPLAVMMTRAEEVTAHCEVGPEELSLLTGTIRPIVLLRRVPSAPGEDREWRGARGELAPSVAPGLRELGVMLPYTPLHHLLMHAVGRSLVMTSGNLSEEPIAMENADAMARLGGIADWFLLHDRPIRSRYDDSVARVVQGRVEMVRRSRGYAPFPLRLPFSSEADILAVGPEQKNAFCLTKGEYAFVSQHIGDMENAETLEHFERTLALYERLFRVEPALVAYDLHPEYLSTKFALSLDLPKVGVQHHHAHVVSVSAEHGVREPVVGFAFDGTGYGTDGRIWGGEVLLATWEGFERFAHLRYVPMPGGAAAVRRPARMAVGTLAALGLLSHEGARPLRSRLAPGEEETLLRMVERDLNSPLTSSMGRLFDTVAALAGVRDDASYEGQAAIELEALADMEVTGSYEFALAGRDPVVIDPTPVLEELLGDIAARAPASVLSARFHRAVVGAIVRLAAFAGAEAGTGTSVLAGGVFMNRIVLGGALTELERSGFRPLIHRALPMNDGAIAYGQAVAAHASSGRGA